MVSLEQRHSLAVNAEDDPQLKRFQLLLDGEPVPSPDFEDCGLREKLLLAISARDAGRFNTIAAEVGQRRISVDSDWCQDDYLLFLLVLGNELFGRPLVFLTGVIEARRNNNNSVPRKINEVFAALERQEFGIEGEFCFLKIPFLRLISKLSLGPSEAQRAITQMADPEVFDQMSPFLKLLTQKAYDLVLTERQPLATETAAQLIEGFERHARDLSLRQWFRVVVALPARMILALVAIVLSLGVVSILIGVGKGFVDSHKSESRIRPSTLGVAGVREVGSDLPTEALLLARTLLPRSSSSGKHSLLIIVESAAFGTATPSFVVEVSHPEEAINGAFAFTQGAPDGARPFTVVPVERDGGRFRAILPEQPIGQKLYFVLEFEADANQDGQTMGRRIALRTLQ
jgi:hypothetical protein